ncbi:MAG TPA: murein biosynthesis integral membrane protein MurJ, partial [Burkholderiales bacterium]|nr:murein biosynthesis integral membrane protein MurJ [Burkholderiales bacterium]
GIAAAPLIVYASAPGFSSDPSKFHLTVTLLRITFPYIFFISLVSLAGGILNTYSRFSVPAFTPVVLNLSFIACALLLTPYMHPPVLALAWAVFIGGILQLLFQVPFLLKIRMLPRFRFDMKDPGIWRILKLMGSAVFGVSISQVSLLINTIFASLLATGSVSWLYYADRLMEFPAGMLGVALGSILLPSLAKHHADRSHDEYAKLLDWGLRLTFLLTLPAALALALLSAPLVSTLFLHGAFNVHDLYMTRNAVLAYSVGLLGLILVKVLAPGFYARQDIRTPVRIAIITLVLTQLMNLAFIGPLKHAGLALAIGLGSCFNAAFLYKGLRKSGIYSPQPGWGKFLLRIAVALFVMGFVIWFSSGSTEYWIESGISKRALRLSLVVFLGILSYFGTLRISGIRLADFAKRGI